LYKFSLGIFHKSEQKRKEKKRKEKKEHANGFYLYLEKEDSRELPPYFRATISISHLTDLK